MCQLYRLFCIAHGISSLWDIFEMCNTWCYNDCVCMSIRLRKSSLASVSTLSRASNPTDHL